MSFGVFQFRRGTAAQWVAENPILEAGELGLELGVNGGDNLFKIGDGVTAWNALDYGGIAGPTGKGITSVARTQGNGAAGTTDTYTITYSDGATTTFNVWNGANGAPGTNGTNGTNGQTPTVGVGTVTTGAAGSAAEVTNGGTALDRLFNFTIPRGNTGAAGEKGWSPILAVVTDGARRVLQIVDWTGGAGTKPSTSNQFLGAAGIVATAAEAVDVRGPTGATGAAGGAEGVLSTDYTNTMPANPASGGILFVRNRGRRLPAFTDPHGYDTQLQPAMFTNRVTRVSAIAGATTPQVDSTAVTHLNNATAVPTAQTPANTDFFSARDRYAVSTALGANTGGGTRYNVALYQLSSIPNNGGFFMVARLGFSATPTNTRFFCGLAPAAVFPAASEPSAVVNTIGFMADQNDANMSFGSNDASGVATKSDLGATFPRLASPASTHFYEFVIFAPSGQTTFVNWSARRLNDGVVVQGQRTTDLPAAGVLLAPNVWIGNGAVGTTATMHIQSIYAETDN